MGNFSAAEVKKLRDLTGAGMMDCKKALEETDGDYDAAVEALRIKGAAKAAKRGAEREATNGLVAAADGAMIELNCETDFVAKNDDFKTLMVEQYTQLQETNKQNIELQRQLVDAVKNSTTAHTAGSNHR